KFQLHTEPRPQIVRCTELLGIVRSRNMFAFSSDERAFNIESYFRTDGPFRRYLSSSSVSLEPLLILALRCAVVDGQTGRSFHTRYNEHIKAITKPYITSNYADHIIDNNHDYNNIETDMEILHITPKSSQLNILEQYEIYKNTIAHPQYILNTQLQFNTHTLFDVIVRHIIQTTNPTIGATHPHPYHRQLHIAEPKSAMVQETLKTTTNSVETGRLSKLVMIVARNIFVYKAYYLLPESHKQQQQQELHLLPSTSFSNVTFISFMELHNMLQECNFDTNTNITYSKLKKHIA
ncbi:hypothetical protein ANN_26129, partial [Periplaneta americana]